MKPYLLRLLLFLLLFTGVKALAQQTYTITGTVTDSVGMPQKAATVFLSGTKRITASNNNGEFTFEGMMPGTYQLAVSMIGFMPYAQNITLQQRVLKVNVALKTKTMTLREVVIGAKPPNYMSLFRTAFIGDSENALECRILNPGVIKFHFDKKEQILTVSADDFLILESKRLGYRIKYQLKDFSYNANFYGVSYDGETSFEEMPGTDKQKKVWAKNRLETYKGSKMHFLRSVYNGKTKKEGFAVYNLYKLNPVISMRVNSGPIEIDADEIDVNKLTMVTDSGLMALNFNTWYIDYYGSKPKIEYIQKTDGPTRKIRKDDFGSVLKRVAEQALIDSRGSTDYRTFYVQGFMGDKRVGDQLPFEYQPPDK